MLAIILGTRPEIIKCAPVILEAQKRGVPVGVIHTGQHYSPEMDEIFFRELGLPAPVAHAHVGSHGAVKQIGLMLERLATILSELKPAIVMVQGDTNSVLAGALAAYKTEIPVAHLEAGLRSFDWTMPEEMNRVLADRMSRWLFAPTNIQRDQLEKENIRDGVHVVGNTIVDAVTHYADLARLTSTICNRLHVAPRAFLLLTMHRPNNVDDPKRLRAALEMIAQAAEALSLRVVFPIHPRTKHVMETTGIRLPNVYIESEPLGYLDLLRLQSEAALVLTDSGGIQEEACILRVPSITLRPNTERPETLTVGASVLHHEIDTDSLVRKMRAAIESRRDWLNPFGDGKTAERVMEIMKR